MMELDPIDDSPLVLLGLVHRDPAGMGRLAAALAALRPKVITVEVSPFGLGYRVRQGRLWLRRLRRRLRRIAPQGPSAAREAVEAFLALPYEYRAALRFGCKGGAKVVAVDRSLESRALLLTGVPEIVLTRNLKILVASSAPLEEEVLRCYSLARLTLKGDICFLAPSLEPSSIHREYAMATQVIKLLLELEPGDRLVHLGGWMHLIDRPGSLFRLLSSWGPRRALLGGHGPTISPQ